MVERNTMSDEDKKEETKDVASNEVTPREYSGQESDKEEVKKEVKEEKVKEKTEEPKPKAEEKKQAKPAPSGKFKELIKSIEELSVLELAELVKELEERFGVSAATPMMAVSAMPGAGGAAAGVPAEEEKANYTIHIADAGAQKIAVIKVIREIRQDLGLKEAKDLVDGAPKDIKADVPKAEAEEAKKKLEAAGAKVELK